jgi:hypothetical protein
MQTLQNHLPADLADRGLLNRGCRTAAARKFTEQARFAETVARTQDGDSISLVSLPSHCELHVPLLSAEHSIAHLPLPIDGFSLSVGPAGGPRRELLEEFPWTADAGLFHELRRAVSCRSMSLEPVVFQN